MRVPAALTLALLLSGCGPAMEAEMDRVYTHQIKQAVDAYEKARDGAPLDRCVKAKLVAIAYEDARDAGNASAWRAREREDCDAAIAPAGVTPPLASRPSRRP